MIKNKDLKVKKITMGSFLMTVFVFLVFNFYLDFISNISVKSISGDLRLKVPKEKIITYTRHFSENNQEEIVQYVYNTNQIAPAGTYLGLKEDLSRRTVNSQSFLVDAKEVSDNIVKQKYIGKFYPSVNFYQANNQWYATQVATTTKDAWIKQTRLSLVDRVKGLIGQPVFAATDTTYSGAGDGDVYSENGLWVTAHNATAGTAVDYLNNNVMAGSLYSGSKGIYRGFLPFDTSSLDDAAVISDASLNVYVLSKTNTDNDGDDFITVVQTTQASNTSLVLEDFDQAGNPTNPTEGIDVAERKDITAVIAGSYLTFDLNSTGLGWISKTGYTNLGLREGHDVKNVTVVSGTNNSISISSSEQGGVDTSQDPYLSITYTVDSAPPDPDPDLTPSGDRGDPSGPAVKGWAKILSLGDDGWLSLSCDNDGNSCAYDYGVEQVNSEFGNCSTTQNVTCKLDSECDPDGASGNCPDCQTGETCNFRQSITLNGFSWSANQDYDGVGYVWFNPPVNQIPAWLQTKFGDIYARRGLTGSPPPQAFNATYRILSSGGISNFLSESGGEGTLFYDDNFGEINFPTPATRYSNVLGQLNVAGLLCDGACGDCTNQFGVEVQELTDSILIEPIEGGKIYCRDGDLSVNTDITFDNQSNFDNGAITFVVDGNLNIENNLFYEQGSPDKFINLASVAWIVQGDLNIDPSVDEMVGNFIVLGDGETACSEAGDVPGCGQIKTCSTGIGCENRLVVSGLLMAKKFFLEREFPVGDLDKVTQGSEIIIYDGRMLANTPPGLADFAKALPIWRSGVFSQ